MFVSNPIYNNRLTTAQLLALFKVTVTCMINYHIVLAINEGIHPIKVIILAWVWIFFGNAILVVLIQFLLIYLLWKFSTWLILIKL
jgi:hypothetical protein